MVGSQLSAFPTVSERNSIFPCIEADRLFVPDMCESHFSRIDSSSLEETLRFSRMAASCSFVGGPGFTFTSALKRRTAKQNESRQPATIPRSPPEQGSTIKLGELLISSRIASRELASVGTLSAPTTVRCVISGSPWTQGRLLQTGEPQGRRARSDASKASRPTLPSVVLSGISLSFAGLNFRHDAQTRCERFLFAWAYVCTDHSSSVREPCQVFAAIFFSEFFSRTFAIIYSKDVGPTCTVKNIILA